ncbi:MAG: hypothetical protein EAZ50_07020 [Runella slithyformis]|nr:MAG: hypothetical protein EAZ50_07020 [Runella slithyformis]
MKKNCALKWGTLMVVSYFILSCHDKLATEQPNNFAEKSNLRLSSEAGAVELNYETETTRRTEITSFGLTKASASDVIYSAPVVVRSAVKMKIMPDGSLESESVELVPSNTAMLAKHKSLPDPNGRYFKRVIKGNFMEIFDRNGRSKGQQNMNTPNMKAMLDEIKAAKAKSEKKPEQAMNNVVGFGASTILEMAQSKNAQIKDRGKNVKEVTLEIDEPTSQSVNSFRMSYVLDIEHNRILSGKLLNKKTGELLNQTVYLYRVAPETGKQVISRVYSVDFYDDKVTSRKEKTTTVTEYKSFEFIDNLN